jgi:hypothetical protein
MNTKTLAKIMFLTCTTVTVCASLPAFANNTLQSNCTSIDLRDGTYTPLPQNIEFVVPPDDNNGDGYYEAVLKITLKQARIFIPKTARFSVLYDGVPEGNSVNIGDSETNNGGAGDAKTQSNDAEMQIGRQGDTSFGLDPDATLWVNGHDGYPPAPTYGPAISIVPQSVRKGDTITLDVANERLSFNNPATPLSGNLQSSWLYSLKGQPDSEGPVNYDIFASFNRVIYDPNNRRLGRGVGNVKVCLFPNF